MNIVEALRSEEVKLERQLVAIRGAIVALNGSAKAEARSSVSSPNSATKKRIMSAAVRARISQKAKARWAKIRAERSKGKATK